MLAGTFAMNAYQLTNAWFVAQLGTEPLAAFSFTFPVVMFFMLVTRGLGTGAMALIAHALGSQDNKKAKTLTSHALLLAMAYAALVTAAGLGTIKPLFTAMGATGTVLEQTTAYMKIWYAGSVIMTLQIIASDMIVATGNTKTISALMVVGTMVNLFLDYILIFGHMGMPRMGISGAALATLLSQAITFSGALFLLSKKFALIDWHMAGLGQWQKSWIKILKFGVPGALGLIMTPLASAVITRLVAGFGNAAVAAIGVASRIEMFAFMIPMTVGMSLMPFIAQNYGAGHIDRIKKARTGAMLFAVLYGFFICALFIVFADTMAGFFSQEQSVIDVLKAYIYITCAGYGMLEVHRYAGFCLTGIHEPLKASLLNIVRVLVYMIPLSLLGIRLFQLRGIFYGRLTTDILAGVTGIVWSGMILKTKINLSRVHSS